MFALRVPNGPSSVWAAGVLASIKPEPNGCWRWTRYLNRRNGYGQVRLADAWEDRRGRVLGAHRFSYLLIRGPIPPGDHIDHRCRNKWCVNPFHLEVMSASANIARGNKMRTVPIEEPDWGAPASSGLF